MKTLKVACVGAGNRGIIYSNFAIKFPERMKVVAVVDPNELHRTEFAKTHEIPKEMQFASVEEFVAKRPECDLVINATIDNIHCEISKPLLLAGYDVLMEKPITANVKELLNIRDTAINSGRNLFVCHVLRYTPFYKGIKERIIAGDIGKITSVNMTEHVGVSHYVESYVVGKWRSEEECGSPFLLAKSCHDLDMMCWLNNASAPEKVASFADRKIFIPENAPEGATETCHTCPHENTCKYSVTNIFNGKSGTWKRIIHDVDKPVDKITQEDINEQLKKSSYGRCVYEAKDLVDRQNVILKFENGSVGTFDLIGATSKGNRFIRIVGEDGEIFGTHGENRYTVRRYDFKNKRYEDKEYDVSVDAADEHLGGDTGMMGAMCNYLNGDRSDVSITDIHDSVNGHLCVYAAEKSRKTDLVINLKEEYK
ncbi:MAG: Gfo/Idh/MocA family oxidoreductase [Ruminococcaceae bacterium]|nr:Gfo/Idh/MocA family oxidoreductase [Oscillospiraceae bacterium]